MSTLTASSSRDTLVITSQSSKYDKYNAFLRETISRCADLRKPYDRKSELAISNEEVEEFCESASSLLGLPVIYITEGYYAAYPTFEMLQEKENER